MKTKIFKKLGAGLLAFMMVLSMLPATNVFASELEPTYLPEVKRKVEEAVNSYMTVSNNTTKSDIEAVIQKEIDIESSLRDVTFTYVWDEEPTVTPAEIGKLGWINGKLTISAQGYSGSIKATIHRVIAMLPFDDVWYIDNALSRVNAAIKKAEFTNETTKETIMTLLKDPAVLVYNVTAEWKVEPVIVLATSKNAGSIKGNIVLTKNSETRDVTVDKTIAKLPKTDKEKVDEAKPLAETALGNITATNDTTGANILDAVNTGISSVNDVTATWKIGSPVITLATTSKAGSIIGTIVITCGNEAVEVPVKITIDKLADWEDHKASDFSGGDGSSTNPYKIATAEQLSLLAYQVNNGNSYANEHFQLENNIDLSAYRWVPIGLFKWEQDGTTINNPFSGSFDGNNKTISGLNVDERTNKNSAGFFGYVSDKGISGVEPVIKNLTISEASIYANEEGLAEAYSGILAGNLMVNQDSILTVSNVTVSGTINNSATDGNFQSGGITGGASRVEFIDCKANNVTIQGASNTGGFVGHEDDSKFTNCHATGSVSGSWSLGGFVGYSTSSSSVLPSTSSYMKCSADVNVTGVDWRLGGFVGFLEGGKIKNSIAYGDVTSSVNSWEPKTGGFAGENSGTIEFSYAEGTITNAHPTIKAGGFIGFDNGGTTNKCMFDKTLNASLSSIGTSGTAGVNDIKEGTTQENKIGICVDILDGHEMDTSIWISDDTEHWNTCGVCNGKFNIEVHTYGDWVIDTEATEIKKGSMHRDCSVCEHRVTEAIPLAPHTHTPSTDWSKDETSHWHECTANDGHKTNIANHTFGEWVVDTSATATTMGSKHRDCMICGHRVTEEIPAIGETPIKPTITVGGGFNYQISAGKDMTLTCSGNLEDLTGVYVDEKLVDPSNYTLKSGSTILTLKASYLDTLSAGKHTLKFQYKDNVLAETEFTIAAKAETVKPSSPETGDTSNTMLYLGLIALSGCAVVFGLKKEKNLNK